MTTQLRLVCVGHNNVIICDPAWRGPWPVTDDDVDDVPSDHPTLFDDELWQDVTEMEDDQMDREYWMRGEW